MEWIGTKYRLPQETGKYIASIHRPFAAGISVSSDLAHYDAEQQRWYKYDPFDDKYKPTEDITNMVVGWIDNMVSYLGG